MEFFSKDCVHTDDNEAWVLKGLMDTSKSTTKYLESLKKANLQIFLEKQLVYNFFNKADIIRYSFLHFGDSNAALVYSTCILNKRSLSIEEFHLIEKGEVPIGSIFLNSNVSSSQFKKENISTEVVVSRDISSKLNVGHAIFFKKVYTLLVDDRDIGMITEYFNPESISRIFN